jgi:hypothetical protein
MYFLRLFFARLMGGIYPLKQGVEVRLGMNALPFSGFKFLQLTPNLAWFVREVPASGNEEDSQIKGG